MYKLKVLDTVDYFILYIPIKMHDQIYNENIQYNKCSVTFNLKQKFVLFGSYYLA